MLARSPCGGRKGLEAVYRQSSIHARSPGVTGNITRRPPLLWVAMRGGAMEGPTDSLTFFLWSVFSQTSRCCGLTANDASLWERHRPVGSMVLSRALQGALQENHPRKSGTYLCNRVREIP